MGVIPKAFIGVLLGLVLQLVQIMPAWSAEADDDSPGIPKMAGGCCGGHCCCATEKQEKERPAPLVPPARESKAEFAAICEDGVVPVEIFSTMLPACSQPRVTPDRVAGGYAGVALGVAYCRFLI